jgi:transcription elongation factor Elf1
MGKKLTSDEITELSKNQNQGFDCCHVCGQHELANEMTSIDPKGMSWDLICEECDNQLIETVKQDLDNSIDKLFAKSHQYLATTSGDITPEQQIRLDELKEELLTLIITQTKQNV